MIKYCRMLAKRFLIAGIGVYLVGCGSGSSSEQALQESRGFDFNSMLANYADNIILPVYAKTTVSAQELVNKTKSYCAMLQTAQSENTPIDDANIVLAQMDLQQSWLSAMSDWQAAELLWLGPLLERDRSLRNRIYSYATPNRADTCAIDLSAASVGSASFSIQDRANNTRGLDALEYLFFVETLDHTCRDSFEATQSWNALPKIDRQLARCQLAEEIAEDVIRNTQQLERDWDPLGENYRSLFLNENNAGEHLSQLSDALFYIEKELKDTKLALPLSLVSTCALNACPATVESRFAKSNLRFIIDNLIAFKAVFNGADGLGFDDIIRFENQSEVADLFNQNIDRALQFANELAESGNTLFTEATQQQVSAEGQTACVDASAQADISVKSYCTLHGLVKVITDQLRTDFVTIVNVDLPKRTQTDND